jgi:hypothetical protein
MFLVTGANVTFDGVDFGAIGTSAQAIQWLLTTNAADFLTIKNCRHRSSRRRLGAEVDSGRRRRLRPVVDNTFQIVAAPRRPRT